MAYKGQEYKGAPRAYAKKPISVFVKISSGTPASLEVYEGIDGLEWSTTPTVLAAYEGSADWAFVQFVDTTFPVGTLLQLRCVGGAVTVDQVLVVQDW